MMDGLEGKVSLGPPWPPFSYRAQKGSQKDPSSARSGVGSLLDAEGDGPCGWCFSNEDEGATGAGSGPESSVIAGAAKPIS